MFEQCASLIFLCHWLQSLSLLDWTSPTCPPNEGLTRSRFVTGIRLQSDWPQVSLFVAEHFHFFPATWCLVVIDHTITICMCMLHMHIYHWLLSLRWSSNGRAFSSATAVWGLLHSAFCRCTCRGLLMTSKSRVVLFSDLGVKSQATFGCKWCKCPINRKL